MSDEQNTRWRLLLMVGAPIVAALVIGWFYVTGGRTVSTDNAYVQASRVAISTDVAGRVVEVDVHENQPVRVGQVLFKLDDRPYVIAVEQAQAQLEAARLQVSAAKAGYRQRQAELQSAHATLAFQEREFERQKRLLASGIASQSQFDQADHALEMARRQVAATEQQVASALANLAGDSDIRLERHPLVQEAQAALDRARLNLSYTVVRAPEDGTVTKVDQLQPGDYVNAATPVFSLVSSQHLWIEANFKETDLTHMHPGQPATVTFDTYSERTFAARVTSVSPGTGSSFSVLPPENATGNWVKVVQRVPVRIELAAPPADIPLQAGLSADVTVDTGHRRTLWALIEGASAAQERPGTER